MDASCYDIKLTQGVNYTHIISTLTDNTGDIGGLCVLEESAAEPVASEGLRGRVKTG